MSDLSSVLEYLRSWEIYNSTLLQWAVALGVFIASALGLLLVRSILTRRARRLAERFDRDWMDALAETLERTKALFLIIVALFLASRALTLAPKTEQIIEAITVISLLLQGVFWGNSLLVYSINRYTKQRLESDPSTVTMVSAMGFIGKLALWTVAVLLALDNLGVEVTAALAGLGIGGVAVALAAQNILGDLFASLSIVLDKPFVLGDFIIVGDVMGTVEHIGLKTTRLRSLSGEQLVCSNNDLLQSRIRNFKRMWERRVVFTFGVVYETPREKLAALPVAVREIVQGQAKARFDRAHWKQFGDFALIFEVVYFVTTPEFNTYMDIQQAINLQLYEYCDREGIRFAYPTQTIYLQSSTETRAMPQ